MNVVWIGVLSALCSQGPPLELKAVAEKLRQPGAKVMVGRDDEGAGWEVWFDCQGKTTNESFARLHDVPKLGAIRFLGGGFDDRGVSKLKNLPDLHLLVLFSEGLTDKCLDSIVQLKGLKKLDLGYARLTGRGLKKLKELPKLERLYLYNARFEDRDAEALTAIKSLTILDLPMNLSSRMIDRLRKALPRTQVQQRK